MSRSVPPGAGPEADGSAAGSAAKAYDRAYFDRWYRSARRVATPAGTRRKAALALAAAEFLLGRDVRSVLDVGCGEGQWRGVLRRMRPGLRWVGVDPSPYVVRRFGRRRGIRPGSFAQLDTLRLGGPFDLIVCADVLHYLDRREIERGLPGLVRRLRGLAWIEAYTVEDVIGGDRTGWHVRRAAWYRNAFAAAGLVPAGLNSWVTPAFADARLASLERPPGA